MFPTPNSKLLLRPNKVDPSLRQPCFRILPFIHHKVTLAFLPLLQELFGGVDVGEDGDKGNDTAEDPDCNDERHNHSSGEIFSVGFWESYNLAPPEYNISMKTVGHT